VTEEVEGGTVIEQQWEIERGIPLTFAFVTRYLGSTDRLRCNAFEVRDSTGNSSSGVIHCGDSFSLTSWSKCISDVISGLNNFQVRLPKEFKNPTFPENQSESLLSPGMSYVMKGWNGRQAEDGKVSPWIMTPLTFPQIKLWSQETQNEIYYIGWVSEGTAEKSSDSIIPAWLSWKSKILCFRGNNLYYMQYPPVSFPFIINQEDPARRPPPSLISISFIFRSQGSRRGLGHFRSSTSNYNDPPPRTLLVEWAARWAAALLQPPNSHGKPNVPFKHECEQTAADYALLVHGDEAGAH